MITIIGSGLTGATTARLLTDSGYKVTVIEDRRHVGGNVFTPIVNNIPIHHYGVHIFHTNSDKVWQFVNRFTEWKPYVYSPFAYTHNRLYSFPINLLTLQQIEPSIKTPFMAQNWLRVQQQLGKHVSASDTVANLEEDWLHKVGPWLYELFFKGYSMKQWGMSPKEMLPTLSKRVPINTDFNNNYFPNDKYQALPIHGYSALITGLLKGIEVKLNSKWEQDNDKKVIYTGMLDALFNHDLGHLPYRSLRFDHRQVPVADTQGCSVINYCDLTVQHTRVIEHRYFLNQLHDVNNISITIETPVDGDNCNAYYYPQQTRVAQEMANEYRKRIKELEWCLVGGRQGRFAYINMDTAILEGMELANKAMSRWRP